MAKRGPFLSLTGRFDAEAAAVIVGEQAHVAETVERQIARRIARDLVHVLPGQDLP